MLRIKSFIGFAIGESPGAAGLRIGSDLMKILFNPCRSWSQ